MEGVEDSLGKEVLYSDSLPLSSSVASEELKDFLAVSLLHTLAEDSTILGITSFPITIGDNFRIYKDLCSEKVVFLWNIITTFQGHIS